LEGLLQERQGDIAGRTHGTLGPEDRPARDIALALLEKALQSNSCTPATFETNGQLLQDSTLTSTSNALRLASRALPVRNDRRTSAMPSTSTTRHR
jgi:hypothetical protein